MHLKPPDPALLVDAGEECRGWSKAVENRHGVQERICKCERARIIKVTRKGLQDMFLPMLDGDPLPPYFKLGEAKDAVEAAAAGQPLPRATRPFRQGPLEYRNIGEEAGTASYEATKAWMGGRVAGLKEMASSALDMLGLQEGATPDEIKLTVRRLKMEFHPDRNPGDEEAADRFRQVIKAAELLEAV
jgi:hypothetical protein